MSDLQTKFDQAAADVRKYTSLSNDELLVLYKYYKQATVGDNNTTRPGMLDLSGKAKWDAWTSVKGTSQDAAKDEYIKFVASLAGRS